VPGEGEHKILDFIRQQRALAGHNPNTKHCIYGADADLIMLGLITHEPHFYIIRESLLDSTSSACALCGQSGHFSSDCKGTKVTKLISRDKFQFLRIPVLREYLYFEFEELSGMPWFDFERVIDDFIFLCFFVGNDFLPHLPSLHIRDGAIDGLIFLYKRCFPTIRGFLTERGKVDLSRVNVLLGELAKAEDEFFKNKLARETPPAPRKRKSEDTSEAEKNLLAAKRLQKELEDGTGDSVRLGEEGWKWRYYHQKFFVGGDELREFIKMIRDKYLEGLCWVFQYYFNGVQSWGWYYPFHYAPFASDLLDPTDLVISFEYGRPFPPIAQLMAVFPPDSIKALPECMHSLALEPDSPIADFYPVDFKLDINGKRFAWQGVMLLPFIEEDRLLQAIETKAPLLSWEETERNSLGETLLYCNKPTSAVMMTRKASAPKFTRYHLASEVRVTPVEGVPCPPHQSSLLQGCVEPRPRIDRHLFSCGDRRGFGAQQFIGLLSRYLMLPAPVPQDPYPIFSRSYNTNRAVCEGPRPVMKSVAKPSSGGSLLENLQKLVLLLGPTKPKG
jgi:5'-3' exoribonuclease 2